MGLVPGKTATDTFGMLAVYQLFLGGIKVELSICLCNAGDYCGYRGIPKIPMTSAWGFIYQPGESWISFKPADSSRGSTMLLSLTVTLPGGLSLGKNISHPEGAGWPGIRVVSAAVPCRPVINAALFFFDQA